MWCHPITNNDGLSTNGWNHEHFSSCLQTLAEYNWIYDFQLTNFISERVWENIPKEWIQPLTESHRELLNQVPSGYFEDSWPDSLKKFVRTCSKLSLPRSTDEPRRTISLGKEQRKGMNPKKQHEVSHVAAIVDDLCKNTGCGGIVDVGSGLGYLSLMLSHQLGYRVLGVECEEARCQGAALRASNIDKDKLSNFQSIPVWLKDDDTSIANFQDILANHFCHTDQVGDGVCEGSERSDNALYSETSCQSGYADTPDVFSDGGNDKTSPRNASPQDEICECHSASMANNIPVRNPDTTVASAMVDEHPSDSVMSESHVDHTQSDKSSICDTCGKLHCGKAKNHQTSDSGNKSQDAQILKDKIAKTGDPMNICLVGLHTCGDLTPTMLRMFSKINKLKALVAFSCCYHRMTNEGDFRYNQFPMSESLQTAMAEVKQSSPGWSINTYALRLAAQETRSRWINQTEEDHLFHQNNVAFRGILEVARERENLGVVKERRRLAGRQCYSDFTSYLEAVIPAIVKQGTHTKEQLQTVLQQLHDDHEQYFRFIEPFTSLQVTLQGVLESLILVDRLVFLQEQGLSAQLCPVMDDYISPRNMAIIAWKS